MKIKRIPWNKGLTKETNKIVAQYSNAKVGQKRTDESRKKMSLAQTGKKLSKETREKMSNSRIGRKHSDETKKKLQDLKMTPEARKKNSEMRRGEKSHLWKGGVTKINDKIRKSFEYKLWREAVFKRDNYMCTLCGENGYIEADHIKPFALFPELRFAIDNGRTLCKPCHKTTDTYGNKTKQLKDYARNVLKIG